MDIVEDSPGEWEDDLIWEFLHIPKLVWVPEFEGPFCGHSKGMAAGEVYLQGLSDGCQDGTAYKESLCLHQGGRG